MGVTLQNLTPQLAEYFGLKDRSGALITSVRDDSPASRAGLKAGDIILAIDGEKVEDPGDAMRIMRKKEEGPVDIRLLRDRREMNLTVTLEKPERSRRLVTPEIDIHLAPLVLPDLSSPFVAPSLEVITPPAWLWRTPEIRAPFARPGKRIRVPSGVI
jgi:serine protease Do